MMPGEEKTCPECGRAFEPEPESRLEWTPGDSLADYFTKEWPLLAGAQQGSA